MLPIKPMTDGEKQKVQEKWQPVLAEYQRTEKTYSTMQALHTLAQYWVENEFIIERTAAAKEKEQ